MSVRLRNYRIVGNLLYFGTRICIPRNNELRRKIIYEHHDTPFSAQPGIDRTYLSVQRLYYWPKMDKLVRKYVSSLIYVKELRHQTTTQQAFCNHYQFQDSHGNPLVWTLLHTFQPAIMETMRY